MRWLLAWVISFSRKDQIVNQAVRELTEIARQRANLSASIGAGEQSQGYQQARLRRHVREYLALQERDQQTWSQAGREQLMQAILERLAQQNLANPAARVSDDAAARQVA